MNTKCDRCGEESPADIHTCTRPAGTNPNSWIVMQLFEGLPLRKLRALMDDGWVLNGVSIERLGADGVPRRGAATTGGMVLWWHETEEQQAPVQAYTPKTNAEWTVLLENRFGLGALSQRDLDIAIQVERMAHFAHVISKGQP